MTHLLYHLFLIQKSFNLREINHYYYYYFVLLTIWLLIFISAFETFGGPGKMAVEMSMIGFMVGTCIAFFVVIGDLAQPIIATLIDVVPSQNLRIFVLFGKQNYLA